MKMKKRNEQAQSAEQKRTTMGKILGVIVFTIVMGLGIAGFILDQQNRLQYFTGLCFIFSIVWGAKAYSNRLDFRNNSNSAGNNQ